MPSNSSSVSLARPSGLTASSLFVQLSAAAVLGLFMVYAVGFSHSPLAHNAAHDVRHITAVPCH